MSAKENIVAIIPARGGSKGIPGKNIRDLAGKPLIAHSILDARESKYVTGVYVTTDDAKIAGISEKYGAKIIRRPKNISGSKASSESALIHAVKELEKKDVFPDLIVFLQCTSPIRTGKDIDNAIETLRKLKADSIISVVANHNLMWQRSNGRVYSFNYDYRHRPRRQDMKPQYAENGSIFIFKPDVLKKYKNRLGGKVAIFEMGYWSSFDIDVIEDFEISEWIMRRKLHERTKG